jgi:glycosyltransferase involved in cell wall biosynthesis
VTARVAYVVSLFPCWSETFVLREIQALRARGLDVRVFSLRPPREALVQTDAQPLLADVVYPRPAAAVLGLARHPIAALGALREAWREAAPRGALAVAKALYTVAVAAQFARTVRRLGVRHVHAHFATYPALAARTMRRIAGVSYSVTTHAHDIFLPNPHLRPNLDAAHTVVTISEYNRRHLAALGADDARMTVVPCGLDLAKLQRGEGRARTGGSIVAVGRLVPIKGFAKLIDACALLQRRGVPFTCDIIGGGPLHDALEHRIAGYRLDGRVRLVGALEQAEVQARLAAAELCVVPSVRTPDGDQDGVPVALMEAMALEVPVVTTRVSGIPELVRDGVSGLLVEPGDVCALAAAIERLLRDRLLRARLALGGRAAVARRQDIAVVTARMQEIFGDALAGRPS